MPNWDAIMKEAKRLETMLRRAGIDLNEAEKALRYYLFKGCDEEAMLRYLKAMANSPPPRSRRTQPYYREISRIWQEWSRQCPLEGADKARAWSWG